MPRFIEAEPRAQATLFPERIEDYIDEDNLVRAIEAFVDMLDLEGIGFQGMMPKVTGQPAYHPSTMLKLYIYGYLNRIQSTRRLERETGRNLELMWLLGRLQPDFKTIANFRRANGKAIRKVCSQFIQLCRKLGLFSQKLIAVDGSKFKANNNRDKNFTPAKVKRRIEEIEKSIGRYFARLDRVDQTEPTADDQSNKLEDKIASLKKEVKRLKELEQAVLKHPDKQISLTDPDARSMRSRGTGIVGYNVQTAVDVEHHLIVAHEVTTQNNDRSQLFSMSIKARAEMGIEGVHVIADRGYYKGAQIKACEDAGITTYIPNTDTSGNRAKGRYVESDFRYFPAEDVYRCPAGDTLKWRQTTVEKGQNNHRYWSSNCKTCHLKSKCTPSTERRVTRWEHEGVLDQAKKRLALEPEKMRIRAQTVEHPFGTLKHWMGATHFQMTRLEHVSTEMSLHVLAYNMKRVINIIGVKALIEAIEALILRFRRLLQLNSAVWGYSGLHCSSEI
jgi:transposase